MSEHEKLLEAIKGHAARSFARKAPEDLEEVLDNGANLEVHLDPHPAAFRFHEDRGQCEAMDKEVYRCTWFNGHPGTKHRVWSPLHGMVSHSWDEKDL